MSHKFFAAVLFFSSLMIFSCKCKDHKHQTDEHLTHEFVAVEGIPIFDVPQDSTFDVNKVGTVSFNGIQAYYLKRNFNEKLKTEGKYVYQMPTVKVRANNLGNSEEVTKPFIDIYTQDQVTVVEGKKEQSNGFQQVPNSYVILTCTSTGLKLCYNTPSLTSPVTTTMIGNLNGWEFPGHVHSANGTTTQIQWITLKDSTEINQFNSTMQQGRCHSLIFDNDPVIIQANGVTYETHPYGTFTIQTAN
ncbi:MAG: hypothetical protein KDC04_04175 [Saprospiraceae bacterium]|nr:hypothetical protein [Saprospiraceae bacterium]